MNNGILQAKSSGKCANIAGAGEISERQTAISVFILPLTGANVKRGYKNKCPRGQSSAEPVPLREYNKKCSHYDGGRCDLFSSGHCEGCYYYNDRTEAVTI